MKTDETTPGIVIDVAPDTGTGAADADAARADAPRAHDRVGPRGWAAGVVIALLALLATGVASWVGYRQLDGLVADLQVLEQQQRAARDEQASLRGSVAEAAAALREQSEVVGGQRSAMEQTRAAFERQELLLAEETRRLQSREAELLAAVADVRRRVGRSGSQWIVAEAEYLLRVANHRVMLAADTASARIALATADQRLRDTGDPGWTGVRAEIARDIAALDAFQAPDRAGLAARLASLVERVPDLALAQALTRPDESIAEQPAAAAQARGWDTLLDDLWNGFKGAVRIRRHEAPVEALLAPQQRFVVHENLKLYLAAARLALLQQDQVTYSDSLERAAASLQRYFDPDDGAVSAMRQSIEDLRAREVRVPAPDISHSLRAFQARKGMTLDAAVGSGDL